MTAIGVIIAVLLAASIIDLWFGLLAALVSDVFGVLRRNRRKARRR